MVPERTRGSIECMERGVRSSGVSKIMIPKGTYLLGVVDLKGPCKGAMHLEVQGTFIAPTALTHNKSSWITFAYIDRLTISGGGTFDGRGEIAWKQITVAKTQNASHFNFIAPGHSINTDGIHIGRSKRINIIDSDIITGDDCISIGDGSQQIESRKNCTVYDTDNGVRIKTWPALHGGIASDMHFEDIIMKNVSNPILIDQVYCPWNQCNPKIPSKVKINNVSFKNIQALQQLP
ncbi:hypothetical protein GH714_007794 [Hevea brasiliensis]|uniref:Pectate lyase superfamily protein domain-containing protein n=1 Tax=Hevea brasiliensis TaxID=3981 RepID=A0A6A6MYP7_HEVBR|nr:hypothetical protein GH714_007794 [Hevea brasiliensis]